MLFVLTHPQPLPQKGGEPNADTRTLQSPSVVPLPQKGGKPDADTRTLQSPSVAPLPFKGGVRGGFNFS